MTATLTMNDLTREAQTSTSTPAATASDASEIAATTTPSVVAPDAGVATAAHVQRNEKTQLAARRRREALTGFVQSVVPGLVGVLLFLLLWQALSQTVSQFPGPAKV